MLLPDLRRLVLLFRLALAAHVATALGFPNAPQRVLSAVARLAPTDEDATLLVVWIALESNFQQNPPAVAACTSHGFSHGLLQLVGEAGVGSVEDQIATWLRLRRLYADRCGDDGLAGIASGACDRGIVLVRHRVHLAQKLLAQEKGAGRDEATGPATTNADGQGP